MTAPHHIDASELHRDEKGRLWWTGHKDGWWREVKIVEGRIIKTGVVKSGKVKK